ncbi:MAG TPA: L,D-transpeptidase family protein [Rhizomicrobium sp.]|nr:L,D-transpeptidase family protein [Rhizomicrobium sp.]
MRNRHGARVAALLLAFFFASSPGAAADLSADIQHELAAGKLEQTEIGRFYASRGFRPAWDESNRALVTAALAGAGREGLNEENYRLGRTAGDQAHRDIELTEKFLRYATDIRTGRVTPGSVYADVDYPKQSFAAARALQAALDNGSFAEFLADLPPQSPGYAFLRETLAHYRKLADDGGWGKLNLPKGAASRLDEAHKKILQNRLAIEDPSAFSDSVDEALRRFQERQGLTIDGKLGPQTLAALNVPVFYRVQQIEANMERWRWLPHRLEDHYVEVNTADASLKIVDGSKVILQSRIVVGKPSSPTPIFSTEITGVTVNPPWNVPRDIARNEILPKLRRNPQYLAKEDMILRNGPPNDPHGLTINWQKVSRANFPYAVQQQPGDKNALGLLKIEMPNRFDVYLHDTPAKTLFSKDERFFSHGCMRVQQVGALARYALTGDPAADVARIIQPDNKTDRIPLKSPLKVYVVYWTVFQAPDGSVAFRKDIYGRDALLIAALEGKRIATAALVQSECSA